MMMPAKSVGGDLYDFFLRDGRLFFCLGDVASKGVPAASLRRRVSFLSIPACEATCSMKGFRRPISSIEACMESDSLFTTPYSYDIDSAFASNSSLRASSSPTTQMMSPAWNFLVGGKLERLSLPSSKPTTIQL